MNAMEAGKMIRSAATGLALALAVSCTPEWWRQDSVPAGTSVRAFLPDCESEARSVLPETA
ncbi:MAG: hypothetical protein II518_02620, partial [Candidatus Methanomethylophilus sp.]|nr:hypothetical protein [Methanomethylophilus sp.]